jgi:hypothetical protein
MLNLQVILHVQPNVYNGLPTWHLWEQDMSAHGYFPVGLPIPLTLIEPDANTALQVMIAGLQKQQGIIKDDAAVKVANIEEQIQKLLCLEYSPKSEGARDD